MGSIIDGQPVNAVITNGSKLDRVTDDQASGRIDLINSLPESGSSVLNVQRHVNAVWQDAKLFLMTEFNTKITYALGQLFFTDDLLIVSQDYGVIDRISKTASPLTFADGDSAWVTLSRTLTATLTVSVGAAIPKGRDIYRICTRKNNSLIFHDNSNFPDGKSGLIGSGVAGASFIKANVYDALSTTLPTSSPYIADGVSITTGTRVLFSNLSSGNNRIYVATVTGPSITWVASSDFTNGLDPSFGDLVIILSGTVYQNQQAIFSNAGTYLINDVVRYFHGVDYYEQNSIRTVAVANNTVGGVVFSVNYVNSENVIVDYSIVRSSTSEIGTIYIKTDGASTEIANTGAYIGQTGVTFSADITFGNLNLKYTSDNSGSSGTLKAIVRRWPNAPGGPAGIPSYSPPPASPITAPGSNGDIQFVESGVLTADDNLNWNPSTKILTLGTQQITALQSVSLSNNVLSPTLVFAYSASLYSFAIVDYSIARNNTFQVGTMLISNDGTNAVVVDSAAQTATVGITFYVGISGSNVQLNYTSSNTGFNSTFKYSMRRWG